MIAAGQALRTHSTPRRLRSRAASLLSLVLAALAWLTAVGVARPVAAAETPVIEAGREAEILALFVPYQLGGAPVDGWALRSVSVEPTHVLATFIRADPAASFQLRLEYPTSDAGERSASFALIPGEAAGPDTEAGLAAVIERVKANDPGQFWRVSASPPEPESSRFLGDIDWRVVTRGTLTLWLGDGVVIIVFVTLVLLGFTIRELGKRPSWEALALIAAVGVGAALRLYLAEPHLLGAWPWSRGWALAGRVYEGPALAWLSELTGMAYYRTDVAFDTNLAFGIIAPLAVYAHTTYLLKDARAALIASVLIALLPSHIRFTRSEVAFIPSIVMSSFSFTLLHVALADESRRLRLLALVALPLGVAGTVTIRPLNVMFLALFVGVGLYLRAPTTPRLRRYGVIAVMLAGGVPAAASFLSGYTGQVGEGLSLRVLRDAFWLLFDPVRNALWNPWITPTLLLAVAAFGAVHLWRTNRRLAVILLGWMLMFHTGHAYVILDEPAMQARYYLHLAVPFVMLAATGLVELWGRWRWAGALVGVYALATPAIHLDFIRDYAFNEGHEYEFVRDSAARVAPGCVVLEFTEQDGQDSDLRFDRIGSYLAGSERTTSYLSGNVATAIEGDRAGLAGRPPEELLRADVLSLLASLDAGERRCVYFYEGLPCYGHKLRDEVIAPSCRAMLERIDGEVVAQRRFRSRDYDPSLAEGLVDDDEITLALIRVTGTKRAGE